MANLKKPRFYLNRLYKYLFCITALFFCVCVNTPDNCGVGERYDPQTQFCHNGKAIDKCGGDTFDPFTHGCDVDNDEIVKRCENGILPPCKPREFTITFDTDGGIPEEISPVTVDSGKTMGEKIPADPKKTGYTFDGWFDDDDEHYESSTVIAQDLTLKAKWTLGIYTLTVKYNLSNGNAGTIIVDGQSYLQDEPITVTGGAAIDISAIVATSYTFRKWTVTDGEAVFGDVNNSSTTIILASDAAVTVNLYGSITDTRGDESQTYRTVKIGNLTWMAENLNYAIDGGSWCYADDNDNCDIYGRLYNWEAAADACPAGWRLPDNDDWDNLVLEVGGSNAVGEKLKSTSGWNNAGDGTDEFGFFALPGGYNNISGSLFDDVGSYGYWWSATEYETGGNAYYRYMSYNNEHILQVYINKNFGYSVRCVK